ncbi:TniQ family protein [Sulfurimonas lithotrophica]|uniref:TniQ family protein n=1 Tax=Sulfurimonas lithotrophica TaxID=2590022 RepID=A0A5P8P286_9BACT|nr:TniQ family protein [Sulfurimonas lithotrophica]QFR49794.1 TniQ family protein [Sulfurimonas lithotrophica]
MIKKLNNPVLKQKNFLIIPIPFEDETLTSWLVRTAYAHKTHPHTFVNQYLDFRHYSFFTTEPDITLDEHMIKTIEQKTNNKIDIKKLMLKTYSGYLQENIFDNPNMFLSKMKFCPVCLRENKVPYFRKTWRIAFYNICHKHKCHMYEECLECKSKLDISSMYTNKLTYEFCHKCGFDLKKARRLPLHRKYKSTIVYQNKILNVVKNGYIQLDDKPIYSFLFFKVFAKLSKLILLDSKHKFIDKHPLYKIVKHSTQSNTNHPINKRVNSRGQSALYGLIMYIFDNYPCNLKEYIIENKLTHYDMTDEMKYVPFWYDNIVNKITPRYIPHSMTVTKEEVKAAKKHLKSIGKEINKANLTKLLGCNFYSIYNGLKSY